MLSFEDGGGGVWGFHSRRLERRGNGNHEGREGREEASWDHGGHSGQIHTGRIESQQNEVGKQESERVKIKNGKAGQKRIEF